MSTLKRLCKRKTADADIGSPYVHHKINDLLIKDTNMSKNMSSEEFLVAKQLLADLPIVPTSERIYDLTDQLKLGLLDDVTDGTFNRKACYDSWETCLDLTREYLRGIGILCSEANGGVKL